MRRINFENLSSVLLDAVLSGRSLTELYAEVHDCLGLPLICFDTSFKLVSYAFDRPFYYRHWEDIVRQGAASESTVLDYDYLIYQEQMYKNTRSLYFDTGTCAGFPQACGPVILDGRLVAYCGIMIEDVERADALAANDMLAEATVALLRRISSRSSVSDMAERILVDNSIAAADAQRLAEDYLPPYAFVIISAASSGVTTLEYLRGMLCIENSSRLGCLSSDKYLFILQCDAAGRASLSDIAELTEKYGLKCGVSDSFSKLTEISERRAQAMLALAAGRDSFATFRDCYADIIENCAVEYFGEYAVKLPSLERLKREDSSDEGDYIATLECYLENFRHHADTSEALKLHRNTVINRVRRIESILGESTADPGCRNKLLVGIDMLRRSREA